MILEMKEGLNQLFEENELALKFEKVWAKIQMCIFLLKVSSQSALMMAKGRYRPGWPGEIGINKLKFFGAQLSLAKLLLNCYWIATELLLSCYLVATELLLSCYWIATELLQNCY